MRVSGFFGTSKKDIQKVTDVVMEVFNTRAHGKYQLIRQHDNGNLLSILVASKAIQTRVKDIFSCVANTGTFYTGLATVIRFTLDDTTFCIANVNISQGYAAETL